MAKLAIAYVALPRICEFARRLHQLHRLGGEEAIDGEFAAVCRAIWGFTLDDFTDDDLSAEDHAWLDGLTQECAIAFAAEQGYDPRDYVHGGCVADWWGFTWMILARGAGRADPREAGRRVVQARREDVVGAVANDEPHPRSECFATSPNVSYRSHFADQHRSYFTMPSTVAREQFEVGDQGITHKSTGYRFAPHPVRRHGKQGPAWQ
jgi:hypothetical protein